LTCICDGDEHHFDWGNTLKITREDLGDRQVKLTIEVDQERVDRALRGVARRISKDYNIPGFRRGRAPYHIVLQRFGRETLLGEVVDELGQEVFKEALENEELEPYDAGVLEDVQLDPLVFQLRIPLMPKVDLGDYRELRLEAPEVMVEEEKVEDELERLRQANVILEPAGERAAQMGDWVSLDVHAQIGDESLMDTEAHEMVLDAEKNEFEIGFAEQVVGMNVGEEKQFTLTLSDDWGEEKAGQEATFAVTLHEIRSRILPELDDDLARTIGDYDTLAELRKAVRDQFEEDAQREADAAYAEAVLDALVAQATIEYPPQLIEEHVEDEVKDLQRRLEVQNLALDDYFKLTGQTEETYRESLRPRGEAAVRRGLALSELARQEKLGVEWEEVSDRISLLSVSWGERAGEVRELLSEPAQVQSITNRLLTDKAVQRLVDIAKGEAPSLEEVDQEPAEEVAVTQIEAGSEEAASTEPDVEEASVDELESAAVEAEVVSGAEDA
jgi:trigger factor